MMSEKVVSGGKLASKLYTQIYLLFQFVVICMNLSLCRPITVDIHLVTDSLVT